MIQEFRSDRRYLNRYYMLNIAVYAAMCGGLFALRPPDLKVLGIFAPAIVMLMLPKFPATLSALAYSVFASTVLLHDGFRLWHLTLLPLSFYLVLWATSYIHNAAHGNIRPAWLGRVIGELCGAFHMVGFPDWTIVHFLHHKYPDDPKLDPHPPVGLGYWKFLNGVKQSIFTAFTNAYFERWGHDDEAKREWARLPRFAAPTQLLKALFWFLLLGPHVFTFLFVTSIVGKNLHYAYFNWATHVLDPDGSGKVMIVNLDHGPFFRFVNATVHGLYFHKNHHAKASLFDPRRLVVTHDAVADRAA